MTQVETVVIDKATGSEGKEQQKETSPEMLAREAAAMLAALSTPTKQK